ncbi:hypothetical protein L484_022520 [Morus notabilis]|uniref:Uncharacterized protein n=1 Tax=Morus notabilis TaxID=981085 RepID=W9QUH1_9ROSA|nr:hypothetical protein L484_022520 [Morus notabilis]
MIIAKRVHKEFANRQRVITKTPTNNRPSKPASYKDPTHELWSQPSTRILVDSSNRLSEELIIEPQLTRRMCSQDLRFISYEYSN